MPRQKDFKRLVRVRMKKTGEAYTTARAHVLRKPPTTQASSRASAASAVLPADYATLAGMSDSALKAKTGFTWKSWVRALDRHGAAQLPHREIARLVGTEFQVPDWWAQTVTVGYERIKGLRARGQRRDGTYEVSKSRTFNVPVSVLFDAWADGDVRRLWMDGTAVQVRTATRPKSMRLRWRDRGIVSVMFTGKGSTKSAVAVQHTRLPDRDAASRLKEYWSERLRALGEVLARPKAGG